jgi:hypothetical protein
MALFNILKTNPAHGELSAGIRSNGASVNYLCLLSALESGWRIQSASIRSGRGSRAAGKYFSLTLQHPVRRLESEMTVEKSASAEALIRQQGIRL